MVNVTIYGIHGSYGYIQIYPTNPGRLQTYFATAEDAAKKYLGNTWK